MPEDDAPVRRRAPNPEKTEIADAATAPHRSAETEKLAELNPPPDPRLGDVPLRIVRPPTERLDPPTTKLPSAPAVVSGAYEAASEPFDRLARAAELMKNAAENLDVDRRQLVAQLITGMSAGLANGPTTGAIEHVGARLVQRLLLAEAGVGGPFTEDQLGQLLIGIATEVIAGVEPHRRASRAIATSCDEKARQYRKIARTARSKTPPELHTAALWEERADERESLARELRKGSR